MLDQIWPATIAGVVFGSVYALLAVGYTLIYRVINVINFAHAEVFMMGTFGALLGTQLFGVHSLTGSSVGGQLSVVLILVGALLIAIAFSTVTSLALEVLVFRKVRFRGGGAGPMMIAALGASLLLQEAMAVWRGRDLEPFPRLLSHASLFHLFGVSISSVQIAVVTIALITGVAADRFVSFSKLGAAIRATAQDPDTATLMGVNTKRIVLLTFGVAGITAGVAGFLFMSLYENTYYFVGFMVGIKAFTAALLGGMGNVRGAILGGLIVGIFENYGAIVVGAAWKDTIVFVVLLVVLTARPSGLLGSRIRTVRV